MELLKTKLIIDERFLPSLHLGYLDYFNRAMSFAQTNYSDELERRRKSDFHRLTSLLFFEEYVWATTCLNEDIKTASQKFMELRQYFIPYTNSFWDLNNFPKDQELTKHIIAIVEKEKTDAIHECASIINKGVKLFGWSDYKSHFLDVPEKLCVLPMIGIASSQQLARNIGHTIIGDRLHDLANHWGFQDSKELCNGIQKYIALQPKVIELVLWYTAVTFETNIVKA
jgi:hypothetical protein